MPCCVRPCVGMHVCDATCQTSPIATLALVQVSLYPGKTSRSQCQIISLQNRLGVWISQTHARGTFSDPFSTMALTMDMLGKGSGAHLDHLQIQGTWFLDDMGLYMNILELRVIILACIAFLPVLQNSMVQIFRDNMTAIRYTNKQCLLLVSLPGCCQILDLVSSGQGDPCSLFLSWKSAAA